MSNQNINCKVVFLLSTKLRFYCIVSICMLPERLDFGKLLSRWFTARQLFAKEIEGFVHILHATALTITRVSFLLLATQAIVLCKQIKHTIDVLRNSSFSLIYILPLHLVLVLP